ncbi:MAG: ABC transporter permease [Defluviitaleaceae bacterium]|nr:ABC transporter permease [Defluviitaleaceae bacterium]
MVNVKRPSAVSSTATFMWRTLLKIKTAPGQLIFDSVVAIVSMLLFTFLFGGAIDGSPREYVQFLLPGMLFMTVLPMTVYAGSALCKDISTGVYDRFRTIGFWQPAPVLGTLIADILKYAIAVIGVVITGLAIGFRPEGGIIGLVLGMLLVVLYAFSLSWVFATIGVVVKKPDSVAQNSMLILYTSIFASNIFTDISTMPDWMQTVVMFNPTTHIVTATRLLMQGTYSAWGITLAIIVCVGLVAVFAPLTFALYARKNRV